MTADGQAICDELRAAAERLGWCELGRRTGRDRTALYRSFSGKPDGYKPGFRTVTDVAEALGYRLQLVPLDVQQQKPVE